jgi:hypothetical protein
MSSDTVFSAIRTFVTTNWVACPVQWENESFVPPDPNPDGTLDPWIAAEVYGDMFAQESIGAGAPDQDLWRETGFANFYVFVPVGSGSVTARQYARQLAELFKGTTLLSGLLKFQDMSIGGGSAASDDGKFWGLPLRISWLCDNEPS